MAGRRLTLKQRIAFDGGEEMEAQLVSIGKAGEAMTEQLRRAFTSLRGTGTKVSEGINRVRNGMARARVEGKRLGDTWRSLKRRGVQLASGLATVARRLTVVTAAALGAAAALTAVARSGAKAVDAAAKTAEGLGLTIEEYTRLRFVAGQAGVSGEKFANILNALNVRLAEAAKGQGDLNDQLGLQPGRWADAQRAMATGAAALDKPAKSGNRLTEVLRSLGVEVRETGGLQFAPKLSIGEFASGVETARVKLLPLGDIVFELADAFAALPAGMEKAAVAAALVGEALGPDLALFLNQGSAAIRAQLAEADRIGVTLTDVQANIAKQAVKAQGRLAASVQALKDQFGLLFAPALTAAADRQTESIIKYRKALLGLVEGVVPRAVTLVNELVEVLASGRNLPLGPVVEGDQFEEGLSEFQIKVLEVKAAVIEFAEDVRVAFEKIIGPAARALLRLFDQIAVGINAAFGTDFTGRQIAIAAFVGSLIGLFNVLGAVVLGTAALIAGAFPEAIATVKELFEVLFAGAGEQAGGDVLAFGDGLSEFQIKVLAVKVAVLEFVADVEAAFNQILIPAFDALVKTFDLVAEGINFVFGTDLSGRAVAIAAVVLAVVGVFATLGSILAAVAASLIIVNTALTLGGKLWAVLKFILPGIGPALRVIGTALLFVGRAAIIAAAALVSLPGLIALAIAGAVILIVVFWDDIKAGAQAAWDFVTELWDDFTTFLGNVVKLGGLLFEKFFDQISDDAAAAADFLVSAFKSAVDRIGRLLKSLARLAARALKAAREALGLSGGGSASGAGVPVLAGGGQVPGRAGGGAVRGPGTPTSDSILSWLSNTEWVMQAKAVRHYGTGFMRAVNEMRLPKLSLGGLVDGLARSLTLPLMPVPAYAHGGPVTAGALVPAPAAKSESRFTLALDGQRFPVRADQEVAEALGRVALRQDRTRIGRPPRRL